jgi:acetyl esterase/lipase
MQGVAYEMMQAFSPEPRIDKLRAAIQKMCPKARMPEKVSVIPVDINELRAEWLCSLNSDPDLRLLYLHGGGYVGGDIDLYRPLAARIAKASGVSVLNIDYRLAPEHPYDAPQADGVKAFCWMLENGPKGPGSARRTFVAGDSAGGGLAITTIFGLREKGIPLPEAAIPISAAVDMSEPMELIPVEQHEGLMTMTRLFAGDADLKDPVISPIFGDLAGLPPMLMQAGGAEPAVIENVRFEERARAAGSDVKLEIWPEMPHVWHVHAPFLPEASQAIERIGEFVRKHSK